MLWSVVDLSIKRAQSAPQSREIWALGLQGYDTQLKSWRSGLLMLDCPQYQRDSSPHSSSFLKRLLCKTAPLF